MTPEHWRWIAAIAIAIAALLLFIFLEYFPKTPVSDAYQNGEAPDFYYAFNEDEVFEETPTQNSGSEYWWLDSGGKLLIRGGVGSTIQGELRADDSWRKVYATTNATDTDNGAHPQNVFRLVSRKEWRNPSVEAGFRISATHQSSSPNRNESNGIFIMSRYIDSENLYYAGVRVDGHAVIKKKVNGVYTTLAQTTFIPGTYRGASLLPQNTWIHLRSETHTKDGAVTVTLSIRGSDTAPWDTLLTAIDNNAPITKSARIGLRTDFMDALFSPISVSEL